MEKYLIYLADNKSNKPIWTLDVSDIELLAGMLAISLPIVDDLNYKLNKEYSIQTNADVANFRLITDVEEEDVISGNLHNVKKYGVWLRSNRRFYYNLYQFETNSFFQGIITICNNFEVDFRDYMYKLPFDSRGNTYRLNGYILSEYPVVQDAPDLNDIDLEQEGNENLVELLHKEY